MTCRLEIRKSWIMPSYAEEIQEQIFAFVPHVLVVYNCYCFVIAVIFNKISISFKVRPLGVHAICFLFSLQEFTGGFPTSLKGVYFLITIPLAT